jgi:hypothetical protein
MERPLAKVENIQSKPKSKWRPLPLDTVVSTRSVITFVQEKLGFFYLNTFLLKFFVVL